MYDNCSFSMNLSWFFSFCYIIDDDDNYRKIVIAIAWHSAVLIMDVNKLTKVFAGFSAVAKIHMTEII